MLNKLNPLIMMSLLLSACHTFKVNPHEQSRLTQVKSELQQNASAAILADACVIRLEVGTSHILADASVQVAEEISTQLSQALSAQSIQLTQRFIPFICATFDPTVYASLNFKLDQYAERTKIKSIPISAPSTAAYSGHEKIFVTMIIKLYQLNTSNAELIKKNKIDQTSNKILLSDAEKDQLKQLIGSRYLFIISAIARKSSTALKLSKGTFALAASIASVNAGSNLVITPTPQGLHHYSIRLLDLEKSEFIWFKTDDLPLAKRPHKNGNVTEISNILKPLFP